MNTGNTINTPRSLKRIIAGALLSGGVAVAGMGLSAGIAEAETLRADQTLGAPVIRRWPPETFG